MKEKFILLIWIIFATVSFCANITGQAFMKTKSGMIKTCAGEKVYLNKFYPEKNGDNHVNDYVGNLNAKYQTLKIIDLHAKLQNNGFDFKAYGIKVDTKKELENYKKFTNRVENTPKNKYFTTKCDINGNFSFKGFKNGTYRIGTTVEWYAGSEKQGGFISNKIQVKDNTKVILTE